MELKRLELYQILKKIYTHKDLGPNRLRINILRASADVGRAETKLYNKVLSSLDLEPNIIE